MFCIFQPNHLGKAWATTRIIFQPSIMGSIIRYALGYDAAYNDRLGGNLSALFVLAAATVICTSSLGLTCGEQPMHNTSTSLSTAIARHYAEDQMLDADRLSLLNMSGAGMGAAAAA